VSVPDLDGFKKSQITQFHLWRCPFETLRYSSKMILRRPIENSELLRKRRSDSKYAPSWARSQISGLSSSLRFQYHFKPIHESVDWATRKFYKRNNVLLHLCENCHRSNILKRKRAMLCMASIFFSYSGIYPLDML
jgi:hypothetical protein